MLWGAGIRQGPTKEPSRREPLPGKAGGGKGKPGTASQGWRAAGPLGPLRARRLGKSTGGGRPWGLVLGTYLTWKSVPGGLDHIRGNPGPHFQGLGEGGSNHSFFIRNLGLIGTKRPWILGVELPGNQGHLLQGHGGNSALKRNSLPPSSSRAPSPS